MNEGDQKHPKVRTKQTVIDGKRINFMGMVSAALLKKSKIDVASKPRLERKMELEKVAVDAKEENVRDEAV